MIAPERLVDVVLVAFVAECAALPLLRRRFPAVPSLRTLAPTLAAGVLLALALRCALAGAGVLVLGPLLALAGAAHVADLVVRARR